MIKIFKTDQRNIYYILEEGRNDITISKCRGSFSQGIFFGYEALEKKTLKKIDVFTTTIKEILDGCFAVAFEQDIILEMRERVERKSI